MSPHIFPIRCLGPLVLFAAFTMCGATASMAQSRSIELHANKNVTAATIGLPDFPNARPYGNSSNDSTADLGFTFGNFHFRLVASKYITSASPSQVLDFYRKPLARYGDVLDCDHGEPVGSIKATRGGLTCSDSQGHHPDAHGDADDSRQLRSGTPRLFRIVAIDNSQTDSTHFSLLLFEVPKDSGSN